MHCVSVFRLDFFSIWVSLVAQLVKNPPAKQEPLIWFLGQEDPWRRQWQPTSVFLPGESHGERLVVGIQLTKSCLTLCDPMDWSTPGFPVLHHLLELAQTHVHWVSDAIQPSHPLSSPSPPAFNLSQHQGLFKLVSSSHQVAKVLELQLQHKFFQWIFKIDWFDLCAVQETLKSLLQHHRGAWQATIHRVAKISSSVYMSIPIYQFIPLTCQSLGSHKFTFYICT